MQKENEKVIDSDVRVQVNGEGESASIYISPPLNGGEEISVEAIKRALTRQKVTYGLKYDVISEAVFNKIYDKWMLVAESKKPVDGVDGSITFHFSQMVSGIPQQDSKGYVDYKNLGKIRNIKAGTVIADITKEILGESGLSIFNTILYQKPGRPPHVTFGQNIELSEDKTQMIAKCDGNLVFTNGRFEVQTVVKIYGNLDVSVGNIDFTGDVEIHGDVGEGFSIIAGGKILVTGAVYSAKLISSAEIAVSSGVLYSELTSAGKVTIGFAENSNINCYSMLKSKSFYNCTVYCKGDITVSGGNGSIIGGRTIATGNVVSNYVGNKGYLATQVIVGNNGIMQQEKDQLTIELQKMNSQMQQCDTIINFLEAKKKQLGSLPDDKESMLAMSKNTIEACNSSVMQINKRLAEIDNCLSQKQDVGLTVNKELYPGVKITINDIVMTTKSTHQRCKVVLGEDGLSFLQI